jgi:ethanolamine ammonia-lyase small subunit
MDLEKNSSPSVQADSWAALKQYTRARIALGRTGVNVPLSESLHFKMMHAHARDAVYGMLDKNNLGKALEEDAIEFCIVQSEATNRQHYLQRPDLGRVLNAASIDRIKSIGMNVPYDVVFILADGLSAQAVSRHSVPLFRLIRKQLFSSGVTIAPVVLAEQARVAIADEIGYEMRATISVILIGERPGLSSPDSLGAYITYNPRPGLTDDARNCVSNIRPEGLPYTFAAEKIAWLITESLTRKLSGVALKENLPGMIE